MTRKSKSKSTESKPGPWATYKAKMASGDLVMWSLTATVAIVLLVGLIA